MVELIGTLPDGAIAAARVTALGGYATGRIATGTVRMAADHGGAWDHELVAVPAPDAKATWMEEGRVSEDHVPPKFATGIWHAGESGS